MKNKFVITIETKNGKRSQVWNAKTPLALGFPFRWIVENNEDGGVRVRNISNPANRIAPASIFVITKEMIESGESVTLPSVTGFSLKLRPVKPLLPLTEDKRGLDGELRVNSCLGTWTVSSRLVNEGFTAKIAGRKIFNIAKQDFDYIIKSHVDGLNLSNEVLSNNQSKLMSQSEVVKNKIFYQNFQWIFDATKAADLIDKPDNDLNSKSFYKTLRNCGITVLVLGLLAVLVPFSPHPGDGDLVPEQFTKIVMSNSKSSSNSSPTSEKENKTGEIKKIKAERTAVVQAFRAKELQSSVSGLLKGGMTKLLAESDFVMGREFSSLARRNFATRSKDLKATGSVTGDMSAPQVKVAMLGGGGGSGIGTTSSVGYGKGEHAKVGGQGRSFVKMDTTSAIVEDGLTKDEVGEVIHRHLSEIRYCYESAMLRTPDIEGKLVVNFAIGSSGDVISSAVKSSTLPDPRLDDCVLRRLVTWKFPHPKGGIEVAVTYPFIFKTLGR